MRICFIDYMLQADKPGRSGMSDTIWGMAEALVERDHHIDIVATYNDGPLKNDHITIHQCKLSPVANRNVVGLLSFLLEAKGIITGIGPDIFHAREYRSTAIMLSGYKPCPIVVTVPGNIYKRIREGHGYDWSTVMINKWAAKVTARKADAVIATSTGMSTAWIQTGVSYDRINTIPLGIDTKRFHFVEGARKVLQLPDGSPILLYVGRYSREKGLYELMEAIGSLADMLRESKAQVILIGKGPLQAVLNSWVAENSLVDLVSVKGYVHQDQLKTWYSAANIMLMPSWNEPFGKVFLEAMACGTPTIATATEGPVDHITHGVNGFLIPIRDIDSLVAQIATALSSPALLEEMCDNCVNYVRSNLSWDAIVTKIVDRVYSPLA